MHIIGVFSKTFRRISEYASVGGNDLSSNAAAPGKPTADPVLRATTLVPVALRLHLFFNPHARAPRYAWVLLSLSFQPAVIALVP